MYTPDLTEAQADEPLPQLMSAEEDPAVFLSQSEEITKELNNAFRRNRYVFALPYFGSFYFSTLC